ncbi:hypothetical protein TNCV_2687131 [Trichonephila clavipes]|nr:hypothetical protein TNCV_2687131 [Trichonephila clavipes]
MLEKFSQVWLAWWLGSYGAPELEDPDAQYHLGCIAPPWFHHNSRNPSVKRSGQSDYGEVNEAELCLIKNLQASAFQEEIEFLAKGGCNSKKKPKGRPSQNCLGFDHRRLPCYIEAFCG